MSSGKWDSMIEKRDKKLKYEFMPDLLSIIEKPNNKWGASIIYILFSLLIVAIIWACIAKIDIVVIGSATIVPEGDVQIVQSSMSGKIQEMKVYEGELVKKGDILAELQSDSMVKDEDYLNENIVVLDNQLVIYNMLLEDKSADEVNQKIQEIQSDTLELELIHSIDESIKLEIEDAEFVQSTVQESYDKKLSEKTELEKEYSEIKNKPIETNEESIDEKKKKIEELKKSEADLTNEVTEETSQDAEIIDQLREISKEILECEAELVQLEIEQQTENMNKENNLNDLSIQISSIEKELETLDTQCVSTRIALESVQEKRDNLILENIVSIEENKAELAYQLEKIDVNMEPSFIVAPIDGEVGNLSVDKGSVVSPMQPILEVVPTNAEMFVECLISNRDISRIDSSQTLNLKLDAYAYSEYGTVKCEIIYISANAVRIENQGLFYEVRARVIDDQSLQLLSGLSGTAEIKIGTRSVMEYFLEPIISTINDSIKEY